MKKYLVLLLFFVIVCCVGCATTPTTYAVRWYDENGQLLLAADAEQGSMPHCDYLPADTAEYHYEFLGWAKTQGGEILAEIPVATEDANYYARVTAAKRVYTITFNSNGGSAVESVTAEYGTVAVKPKNPHFDGRRFVCWCTDSALTVAVDWTQPITSDATYYAKWNIQVDIGQYLDALLSGYKLDPFSYLPESMLPTFQNNLIDSNDVVFDYSTFVSVSNITSQGFGEQWFMVLENLQQSQAFFDVLSVVEAVSSGAVTAFNNYVDQNPSDTARHSIKNGIYTVTIDFDGVNLSFIVDYTATIPIFGEQSVQIALSLNVESGERASRIQIGDANAVRYTVNENYYEFDIKYLGVRRAHFDVRKDKDGNVSGHIYEFITVAEKEIASLADFYVNDKYVIAVGNKADGLVAFEGYIAETYDVTTGKLLGYEVQETDQALSTLTFNTLWFDLINVDGLTSIKQVDDEIYVNGSNIAWETKKVGGLSGKMFSRRFDIEFRTQYFYTFDEESEKYVAVKAEVPMLFVQQENFETLTADAKEANGIVLAITVNENTIMAIIEHYETLVSVFKQNKDETSSVDIVQRIGEKITF